MPMFEIDYVQLRNLFDFQLAIESIPFLLQGVPMTLILSVLGMILGLVIGFFLAIDRGSKRIVLRWPARMYISFIRYTPMIVFIFLLFFWLPSLVVVFIFI